MEAIFIVIEFNRFKVNQLMYVEFGDHIRESLRHRSCQSTKSTVRSRRDVRMQSRNYDVPVGVNR